MILKTEKNRLFLATKKSGIPIEELTYEESAGHRHRLSVRSCPRLWLSVEKTQLGKFQIWRSDFSPLYGQPDVRDTVMVGTIAQAAQVVDSWLRKDVRRYLVERDTPDLWQQLQSAHDALPIPIGNPGTDETDAPITDQERQHLHSAIETFRVMVHHEHHTSSKEQAFVDARLDHLSAVLEKNISRMDWRGLAISALIGIATTLSVSPEQGRRLLELFRDAILQAFRLLP